MWSDVRFCFDAHLRHIVNKAKKRIGLLHRIAGYAWGAEAGVLRPTSQTLVVSLLRYCLTVFVSGAYEQDFRRLVVCVVNPVARRVAGAGRYARLPIHLASAGVLSVHNLYLQRRAVVLDRVLRARNSTVCERLSRWSQQVRGMRTRYARTAVSAQTPCRCRNGGWRRPAGPAGGPLGW